MAATATSPTLRFGDKGTEVTKLQNLLNGRVNPSPGLPENGVFGHKTEHAVRVFQKQRGLPVDGVVGPKTWDALRRPFMVTAQVSYGIGATGGTVFDPAGKSCDERLQAFLKDAEKTYSVKIGLTREMETDAKKQQTMHIAHMIYYNNFKSQQPANHEPNGSKPRGVIKFDYLSKIELTSAGWAGGVQYTDFLRDKDGNPCMVAGGKWKDGRNPEKTQTRAQAFAILTKYGVAKDDKHPEEPHGNMVAPGIQGCGEPCKCGGNMSHHLSGLAADLSKPDLHTLENKLKQANAGTLDGYLLQFGLCRPMSSEVHHVEATNP